MIELGCKSFMPIQTLDLSLKSTQSALNHFTKNVIKIFKNCIHANNEVFQMVRGYRFKVPEQVNNQECETIRST